MIVNSYIYQNPYSQPLQIGRPDPQMLQEQQKEQEKELQKMDNSESITKMGKDLQLSPKTSAVYSDDGGFGMSKDSIAKLSQVASIANKSESIKAYTTSITYTLSPSIEALYSFLPLSVLLLLRCAANLPSNSCIILKRLAKSSPILIT